MEVDICKCQSMKSQLLIYFSVRKECGNVKWESECALAILVVFS